MLARFSNGAPGIYELPPDPVRALTGERMDVCAFLGVAPRGPAHAPAFAAEWAPRPVRGGATQRSVPVAVESFGEYRAWFGGFEGPGMLPWAVASFFDNGGRRAIVVRIAHDYAGAEPGVARAMMSGVVQEGGGDVGLRARSAGAWGNALSASLRFVRRPVQVVPEGSTAAELWIPEDVGVCKGALLRVTPQMGAPQLRRVARLREDWNPDDGVRRRIAVLESPLAAPPVRVELVEGELEVTEKGAPARTERHLHLGFGASHPRFLAKVLVEESRLVYPEERAGLDWTATSVEVPDALSACKDGGFSGGEDHFEDLQPEDFFSSWVPGDEVQGDGVHALADLEEVALVCAPDLYAPFDAPAPLPVGIQSLAGPDFEPCLPPAITQPPAFPPDPLTGLRLDPRTDLPDIIALQKRLVDTAAALERFVVLLDVPPGLDARRIDTWRAAFNSAYAAAYHPWLYVARTDAGTDLRAPLPPSAAAAGIIAAREWTYGLPHGPANELAQGAVDVFDRISPRQHDALHVQNLNVYLRERDGVRLTAARTLSRDPQWRQLSVRRLVTMLKRALYRQMQWAVFEPNGPKLRRDLVNALNAFLRQLYQANAFAGPTEAESFFVRAGDAQNPQWSVDQGRLVVEVGVAPAEPIEFIVLRISREGDGTVQVEEAAHG